MIPPLKPPSAPPTREEFRRPGFFGPTLSHIPASGVLIFAGPGLTGCVMLGSATIETFAVDPLHPYNAIAING